MTNYYKYIAILFMVVFLYGCSKENDDTNKTSFQILADKEKELNDIKSRFVSMASHEFRTPLSTVLSSAELIGKYTKAEEQDKRDRHVSKIKNSVTHLNDILEDFLSLGKLNEGRIIMEPMAFNLENLLLSVKEEMEPLKKSNQQILVKYTGNTAVVSDKKLLDKGLQFRNE